MQNIKDLRDSLIQNYQGAKDKTMDLKTVAELNNTAGKILSSVATELKYHNQQGDKKTISFLEY